MSNESALNTQVITDKWSEFFDMYAQRLGTDREGILTRLSKAWSLNPYMQNERLKKIRTSPVKYPKDTLETMMQSPSKHEMGLRSASIYLHNTVAPVFKLNHMYSDLLTYRTYVKLNEMISESKVEKEYKKINDWIRAFDPQRSFRNIVLQSIIEGKKFYCLREDVTKNIVYLQEMPSDYCKIVHRYEGGWQFSFNMMYFMQMGTSVDYFPPVFRDFLLEFYDSYDIDKNQIVNVPDDVVAYKQNRNWFFWKEIPIGLGWVFGLDDSNPDVVPSLASMFLDANELDSYKTLEQELLMIPLTQLMTAEIPYQKDNKIGTTNNDVALTPEMVATFTGMVKSQLPQGVDFAAAPFKEFKMHQFDHVLNRDSVVGDAVQNFYSQMGISGLLTTSSKPNLAQVKNAQVLEAGFVDKIYNQFKYFMNYCIRKMKLFNKWEIFISGDRFSDKEKHAHLIQALTLGVTSLMPEFLSFYNTDLLTEKATSSLVDTLGLYDSFRPMVSSYQLPKGKEGRPSANPDNVTSDNTALSIEAGTNISENRVTSSSFGLYEAYKALDDESRAKFIESLEADLDAE